MEYIAYTKAELIAMLQLRDAEPTDLQIIDLKIERLTEQKLKMLKRANEVLKLSILSSEEQAMLSGRIQDKAAATQSTITKLVDLKTKITSSTS